MIIVRLSAVAFGLAITGIAQAAVVSFPYTNDFSAGDPPADFVETTETSGDAWSVSVGSYGYTRNGTGSSNTFNDTSFVQAGASTVANFDVINLSSKLRINNNSLGSTTTENVTELGLAFLGSADATSAYYVYLRLGESVPNVNGNLFIIGRGDLTASGQNTDAKDLADTAFVASQDGSTTYTLSVTADKLLNGDLKIDASITDGVNPATVLSFTDSAANVLSGTNFGYAVNLKRRNTSATFDDFALNIVVPEPASLSLLGVAAAGVLRRRR